MKLPGDPNLPPGVTQEQIDGKVEFDPSNMKTILNGAKTQKAVVDAIRAGIVDTEINSDIGDFMSNIETYVSEMLDTVQSELEEAESAWHDENSED